MLWTRTLEGGSIMININIKKISISTVSGNSSGVFVGNNFLPNSDSFSKSNTNVSGNNVSNSINILMDNDGYDFKVIDNKNTCQVNLSKSNNDQSSHDKVTKTNSSNTGSTDSTDSTDSTGNSGGSNSDSCSSGGSRSNSSNGSTLGSNSTSSGTNSNISGIHFNSASRSGTTNDAIHMNKSASSGTNNNHTKEIQINYHSLLTQNDPVTRTITITTNSNQSPQTGSLKSWKDIQDSPKLQDGETSEDEDLLD